MPQHIFDKDGNCGVTIFLTDAGKRECGCPACRKEIIPKDNEPCHGCLQFIELVGHLYTRDDFDGKDCRWLVRHMLYHKGEEHDDEWYWNLWSAEEVKKRNELMWKLSKV